MKVRKERLAEMTRQIASEHIVHFCQEQNHDFGIISVIEVEISKDEEYADLYVHAQEHSDQVNKFLAPLSRKIEQSIAREFGLRRVPKIRFRTKKNHKNPTDILALINSLDKQYGLSE